jgi:peptidoglycan/LPS O-acetylase OafA/YrhL
VDRLVAFGVIAGLVLLLAWTRRRWGEPRLYARGAGALWVLAVLLAAIIVWLALD